MEGVSTLLIIRLLAAAGLLLISCGVLVERNRLRNGLFILGGILLLVYSIHLRDPIFIPLQIVFIISSAYEIYRHKKTIPTSL